MYKDTFNDNVTLYTLLNERRPNKEGLFPIRYRITHKRDKVFYKSGKYCSIKDWELIIDETKKGSKKTSISELRKEIKRGHDAIKVNINLVIENNKGSFSFEKLNNLIKKNTIDTLNAAFIAKINETKSDGKIGTSSYYNCALQSISKYAGNNISFSDVTVKWIKGYEKYMIDKNASYATIGMYCRALRTIINVAKENNIIKANDYPFGKQKKGLYQIPIVRGRKIALTLQQIGELMNADVSEAENKYRDLWFFEYLCNGANLKDICLLKHSDIENETIYFYRIKTIEESSVKVQIEVVLLPEMKEIINRWKLNNNSGYVFPFLNGKESPEEVQTVVYNINRYTRDYIKKIAKRIGINFINNKVARHSFATVLKRSGANISFISESMGHSNIKTTENYLDSFEKPEKLKNAKLLIP
jgi:integrase